MLDDSPSFFDLFFDLDTASPLGGGTTAELTPPSYVELSFCIRKDLGGSMAALALSGAFDERKRIRHFGVRSTKLVRIFVWYNYVQISYH